MAWLLAAMVGTGFLNHNSWGGLPRQLPADKSDFYFYPNQTYFNPATLGPSPKVVVEKCIQDWKWLEANPANHYFGMFQTEPPSTKLMASVRQQAADFLCVKLDECVLMPSTTVSFNTVADGLVESGALTQGDVVVTTDHEHAGGLEAWEQYQDQGFLNLSRVHLPTNAANLTAADIVHRVASVIAATPRARVLSVSHVLTTNGMQLPIQALSALAHAHGMLVVVDGAQAPGGLRVNVTELGCDAYATSAHKWMLAPKGNGLLVLRDAIAASVRPTFLRGGFAPYTGSTGTRSSVTIRGLGHAIDYLQSFGMQHIEEHNLALRGLAVSAIQQQPIPGLEILSPVQDASLFAPILTLGLPVNCSERAVARGMYASGFIVKQAADFPAPHPNAVRIGFHLYNSRSEVLAMVAALARVVRVCAGR